MIKKLAIVTLIFTLLSCKKEKQCDGINFKSLQNDYSLFEVSNELSIDTVSYSARVYYKKHDFFPAHGLFVVLNRNNDTIFTYFGEKKILINSTIFKENSNYFIVLADSKYGNYRLTQNDPRSKLFQIDTLNNRLLDVEPLDGEIFNQFYYKKVGKKMYNSLYCKKDSTKNGFKIYSDLIYNDTIYTVTCPLKIIKKDSNGYKLFAQPKELKKQSIGDKETENNTIKKDILFGKIKGYELVYDCSNCSTARTDGITVYAKKDSERIKLFDYHGFGGDYLAEISLRYFDNHPFIYIYSSHTYGHSQGRLYALDVKNLKTNYVNTIEGNLNIPDSLSIRNYYGVSIENGELLYGADFRSKNGKYFFNGKYNLLKVKRNIYLLEPQNKQSEIIKYQ